MKDQLTHWNNAHAEAWLHEHSLKQTGFAEEVNAYIKPATNVLELGCGEGNDSYYFASNGHPIVATDFSDVVVAKNQERWHRKDLTFAVQDISAPLQFEDNSFDVVYARLSLHYFNDETTQKVFKEISRVLRVGGLLCFMCKEVNDPIYGEGTRIEQDMFERDGHVRHFFSEAYARKLLVQSGLAVAHMETGKEQIYERQSAFIKVFAKKNS
jgi:ubiquinone/menaquinone biosynthesis C-methylase UbiE